MGTYFNPADQVSQVGRHLNIMTSSYDVAREQLRSGEQLVALMDNGIRAIAPFLPDRSEFETFYQAYYQGYWLHFDLYAVPAQREARDAPTR